MAHTLNTPAQWTDQSTNKVNSKSLYAKWLAIEDSQADNKTLWYVVSMVAQGVFFLPIPAVLMYYFNAPIFILVITLGLFFANIIAGMGGASIRMLMSLFLASIIIHALLLAIFII
jgi:hypothetical protein